MFTEDFAALPSSMGQCFSPAADPDSNALGGDPNLGFWSCIQEGQIIPPKNKKKFGFFCFLKSRGCHL
jgi:hypothetical protein